MVEVEPTRHSTIIVGTTPLLVSSSREANEKLVFYGKNMSTGGQTFRVILGDYASEGGIVLSPMEFIADSKSEGYKPHQGPVWVVSDAAGGVFYVFERG